CHDIPNRVRWLGQGQSPCRKRNFPRYHLRQSAGRLPMAIQERAGIDKRWGEYAADEWSDAVVTAMKLGGIDHLFFVSGSEIGFYQEATIKAHELGRPSPRLVTMMHEQTALNAALGVAMVSGPPAATA